MIKKRVVQRQCIIDVLILEYSIELLFRMHKKNLVVEEREAGDEGIQTIKSRLNQVLRVMTEELKEGKHSKASVLEFLKFAGLKLFRVKVRLANLEITKESPVVNSCTVENEEARAIDS